ncbi:hypothetical protein D3C73_801810 [compost metagenome]
MAGVLREELEKAFKKVQGNFRIEGIEIKDEEKELLFDLYTGKIAKKEFYEKMGVKH